MAPASFVPSPFPASSTRSDFAMRTLLLTTLLLPACKVEIAPVPDSWHDVHEDQGRTSLGERTTLDGSTLLGVTRFAEHMAIADGELHLVESADGMCGRRIRSVSFRELALDSVWTDVDECETPDPLFGTTLDAVENLLTTGGSTLRVGRIWRGPESVTTPEDPNGFLRAWRDDDNEEALHALPTFNQIEIRSRDYHSAPVQVLTAPDHLSDQAGFGTELHLLDDVLIVEDAFGGMHHHHRAPAYWDDIHLRPARWVPATGPSVDRILAVSGNEILTQRMGFDALEILRFDPASSAWSTVDTLPGTADMGYTQWVFDEVAAFAVLPWDGRRRGVVDRFDRRTGELDASLSLLRPHEDVDMLLEGDHLVVSETSATDGVVHVFDWRDERQEKLAHLPGPHEGYCFLTDSTELEPIVLEDHPTDQDDTFRFVGDAASGHRYERGIGGGTSAVWNGEGVAWLSLHVPSRRSVEFTLGDAWGGDTSDAHIDLFVDGEQLSVQDPYDPEVDPDGKQRFLYYNPERYVSQEVLVRITADTFDRECTSFDLRAEITWGDSCPDPLEPENDGYEGYLRYGDPDAGTYEELPDLLEVSGEPLSVRHLDDRIDRFRVTVPAGATLEIARPVGDVAYRLLNNGWWGDARYSNSDGDLVFTNDDTYDQEMVLVVDHGYLYTPCRAYELHTEMRLPAPDHAEGDTED